MNTRQHLELLFKSLPGIGSKQSERIVTALLEKGAPFCNDMSATLGQLHGNVRLCTQSFQYFESQDPTETLSPITRDRTRNANMIMVVEKDTDIEHIEKSGAYKGRYFVLGGLVPMLKSKTRETIRITELLEHISEHQTNLQEIILAFSFTPEGDHTRLYIETKLHELLKRGTNDIRLSVLGRGLAFGSEIEYSDPATIGYALEHRIVID